MVQITKEIKYQKFRCMKPRCEKILLEYDDSELEGKIHIKIMCKHCKTYNFLNIDKTE